MAKYYVTYKDSEVRIYESDKLNDAIKAAKTELDKPGCKGTYIYKAGQAGLYRSYSPQPYTAPRQIHPRLIKDDDGCICADWPSRKGALRDTSARYNFDRNILVIAGKTIDKHPKFKDVDKFETWVGRYFAEGKDGFDPDMI